MTDKLLMFENKQLKNMVVSDSDIPVKWHLYWLKKNEYNNNYHSPFRGAVPHQHSFFEIHILTAGTLEYTIGEECIKVETGEFIVIPPQTEHVCVSRSDVLKKISAGFEVSVASEYKDSTKFAQLRNLPYHSASAPASLPVVLNLIMDHMDREGAFVAEQKRALLNVFLASVLNTLPHIAEESEAQESPKTSIGISDETVYNTVVQYLMMNIHKNVTLKEISAELLISISQLNRRLLHYSGMTYGQVKDMVKGNRARELLGTEMSMAQISEAIGIGNEYSFNRFFKRVEGMTPGKFREALQSSNYK